MRLYLHHQGNPTFAVVWVAERQDQARVSDLVASFVSTYHGRTGKTVAQDGITVSLPNGYVLKHSKKLHNYVGNQDSLVVAVDEEKATTRSNAKSGTKAAKKPRAPITVVTKESKAAHKAPTPASVAQLSGATSEMSSDVVEALLDKVKAEAQEGNVRGALQACKAILTRFPDHRHTVSAALNLALYGRVDVPPATLAIPDKKVLSVVEPPLPFVEPPKQGDSMPWRLAQGSNVAQPASTALGNDGAFLEQWGDVLLACGQTGDALKRYQRALSLTATITPQAQADQLQQTIKMIKAMAASDDIEQRKQAEALLAGLLSNKDERQSQHPEALYELCKLMANSGSADDKETANVLTGALLKAPTHPGIAAFLAHHLRTHPGLGRQLMIEFTRQYEGAQVMGTLGPLLRKHGALDEAVLLCRRAASLRANAALVLEAMHAHEAVMNVPGALEAIEGWLKALGKGNEQVQKELSPWELGSLLKDIKAARGASAGAFDPLWGYYKGTAMDAWEPVTTIDTPPAPLLPRSGAAGETHIVRSGLGIMNRMDSTAILFNLVKILFASAQLGAAARLIEAGGPFSSKPDGKNPIRNEAAYFSLVRKIMMSAPPPRKLRDDLTPIFLLGDSHVLSGAWRHITLQGKKRLLVPCLVTGCKAYHLKEDEACGTKEQLHRYVNLLPQRAEVVVVLGELDCRERILQEVRSGLYETLADSIQTVVGIYAKALSKLAASKQLCVYVHPVPPVQDNCRLVVRHFNQRLRKAVEEGSRVRKAVEGSRVVWLDMEAGMMEPKPTPLEDTEQHLVEVFSDGASGHELSKLLLGGAAFRQELTFDGAHMEPETYVTVLAAALEAAARG